MLGHEATNFLQWSYLPIAKIYIVRKKTQVLLYFRSKWWLLYTKHNLWKRDNIHNKQNMLNHKKWNYEINANNNNNKIIIVLETMINFKFELDKFAHLPAKLFAMNFEIKVMFNCFVIPDKSSNQSLLIISQELLCGGCVYSIWQVAPAIFQQMCCLSNQFS